MTKYIVTIQSIDGGERRTIEAMGRRGESAEKIRQRVRQDYPKWRIIKVKPK